jgi:hypothetical protein
MMAYQNQNFKLFRKEQYDVDVLREQKKFGNRCFKVRGPTNPQICCLYRIQTRFLCVTQIVFHL